MPAPEELDEMGQRRANQAEMNDILNTGFDDDAGASDNELDAARSIERQGKIDNEPVEGEDEVAEELLEQDQEQKPPVVQPVTAQSIAEAIAALTPKPVYQPEQKKQLTQEEIRERLKVWAPTEDWKKRINDPDTMADAIAEMQIATVNQALAGSGVLLQDREHNLRQDFQPAMSYAQQQQVKSFTDGFFQKYSSLKTTPHEILDAVYKKNEQNFVGRSRDEIYDILAGDAEKVVKQLNPAFDLKSKSQGNSQSIVIRKPVALSGGGQGGSGESANAKKGKTLDGGLWS